MAAIVGRVFDNRPIPLDGRVYENCYFRNCQLIYRGGPPPSFINCEFQGNRFRFLAQAGNTLSYLQSLADPDSGLQSIMYELFPGLWR